METVGFPPQVRLGEFNHQRILFSFVLSAARGHKRMLLPCLSFFFFFNLWVKLSRLKNKQKYREGWWTLFHLLPFAGVHFSYFPSSTKPTFRPQQSMNVNYKNLIFLKQTRNPKAREARLWVPSSQVWPISPSLNYSVQRFVGRQSRRTFNLCPACVPKTNVGCDSAWTTSIIFALIRGSQE